MKDRTTTGEKPFHLGSLAVDAYLADPSRKQQFVTPMFDIIAPRYDLFTKMFSLGMDAGWKREALTAATAHSTGAKAALDLACGTGDFVVALARAVPGMQVTGIDASPGMIDIARARVAAERSDSARDSKDVCMTVQLGDMMHLEVDDASVDVITSGYGVRNVPDPVTAVREMARVLRVGGTLVTLDFYRPESTLWRRILLGYLRLTGNVVGWLWHREPVVYGYISRSINQFMSWQSFSALLEREGFEVRRVHRHLGGGIATHVAIKQQ